MSDLDKGESNSRKAVLPNQFLGEFDRVINSTAKHFNIVLIRIALFVLVVFALPLLCLLPALSQYVPSQDSIAIAQLLIVALTGIVQTGALVAAIILAAFTFKQYQSTALPVLNILISRQPEDWTIGIVGELVQLSLTLTATNVGVGPAINIHFWAIYKDTKSSSTSFTNLSQAGQDSQATNKIVLMNFEKKSPDLLKIVQFLTDKGQGGPRILTELENGLKFLEETGLALDVVCQYSSHHRGLGVTDQRLAFSYIDRKWIGIES